MSPKHSASPTRALWLTTVRPLAYRQQEPMTQRTRFRTR
jgi:hypothetical protein